MPINTFLLLLLYFAALVVFWVVLFVSGCFQWSLSEVGCRLMLCCCSLGSNYRWDISQRRQHLVSPPPILVPTNATAQNVEVGLRQFIWLNSADRFAEGHFVLFIGSESDHWECLSVTHSLTNSLLFSKLDWCDPGMWRWQLKTCRSCYCCWC